MINLGTVSAAIAPVANFALETVGVSTGSSAPAARPRPRVRDHRTQSATAARANLITRSNRTLDQILADLFALIVTDMNEKIEQTANDITRAKETGEKVNGKDADTLQNELKQLVESRTFLMSLFDKMGDSIFNSLKAITQTIGQK